MKNNLEPRRIWIYILLASGIAWLTALVIAFTGGIANNPDFMPGLRIRLTLAAILIAMVYMFAPALANILTRVITHEGWGNNWLRPHFKSGWYYWLDTWLPAPLFVFSGALAYYFLVPGQFDTSLLYIRQSLLVGITGLNPLVIVGMQAIQGMVLGILINNPFTFGEEFDWQAYLLQKNLPLGTRKAVFILGIIGVIWHWPVIALGHNYGINYQGFPIIGMLAIVWFSIGLSFFLAGQSCVHKVYGLHSSEMRY